MSDYIALAQTLGQNGMTNNAALYLGTGTVENEMACRPGISWQIVTPDKCGFPIQLINFGGWGSCTTGGQLTVNDYCDAVPGGQGPKIVWTTDYVNQLPTGQEILNFGYHN